MKISIITTTYNIEDYIEDTIESVLTQKGDFFIEYIVYDAFSTDSTFEKIKKYKKLVDEGFYLGRNLGIDMQIYQEKDNGMYDGIAKGLKKATGDIVAYINGDDYYLPYAFSAINDAFTENTNVNWIMGVNNLYNEKGQNIIMESYYQYYQKFILNGWNGTLFSFIQQESTFWRRKLLDNFDFDSFTNFKLAGDFFLWHSFARNGENLYLINSVLSGFRIRRNQQSKDIKNYYEEMNLITNSYKNFNKKNKICSIVPNILEYQQDKWLIKKYSFKEILYLFKKKKFRKVFKYLLFK